MPEITTTTHTFAVPDSDDLTLEGVFAAEGAGVGGVLRHLHLLHRLPQRRTVTRSIFTSDPNFLRAFRHFQLFVLIYYKNRTFNVEEKTRRKRVYFNIIFK